MTDTLVNLTGYPIDLYNPETKSYLETIPADLDQAYIEETWSMPDGKLTSQAVLYNVQYGKVTGLPPWNGTNPPDLYYIVTLPTAMVARLNDPDRPDVVYPYQRIRNPRGTIIGCAGFARACSI